MLYLMSYKLNSMSIPVKQTKRLIVMEMLARHSQEVNVVTISKEKEIPILLGVCALMMQQHAGVERVLRLTELVQPIEMLVITRRPLVLNHHQHIGTLKTLATNVRKSFSLNVPLLDKKN